MRKGIAQQIAMKFRGLLMNTWEIYIWIKKKCLRNEEISKCTWPTKTEQKTRSTTSSEIEAIINSLQEKKWTAPVGYIPTFYKTLKEV
jgi:hypothetical protein